MLIGNFFFSYRSLQHTRKKKKINSNWKLFYKKINNNINKTFIQRCENFSSAPGKVCEMRNIWKKI